MKLGQLLVDSEVQLKKAGIGTARLDCLVLLEDLLHRDRSWLLAHPEKILTKSQVLKFEAWLKRRADHQPLAYIRGFSEFYGRRFIVNEHVLEPRPESEAMIELLKDLNLATPLIADIGTGSGALAITAKLEIPNAQVVATDIDPECLAIARRNAKSLKASVKFLKGDLLKPLLTSGYQPTLIMANLPYVPSNFQINQAAAMEPRLAIDGGSDGLEVYRRLFDQLTDIETKPAFVLTEALPPQHSRLAEIASASGFKPLKTQDLVQLFAVAN